MAGTTARVGEGVSHFALAARVVALAPHAGYHETETVAVADGPERASPSSALIGPRPRGVEVADLANVWDKQSPRLRVVLVEYRARVP